MPQFDFSELVKNKLAYLILLIVIVVLIIYTHNAKMKETKGKNVHGRKPMDGNGEAYYYGRGSDHDTVSQLLDRIDWSTYLEKRTAYWNRLFLTVLIVSVLIFLFVWRKIPHPSMAIFLFLAIFIPIYASHQFDYVHGDIYNDYHIKHNVELLRKKLGAEKRAFPPKPTDHIPSRTTVMNPL